MDFLQLDESADELNKHISTFSKGVKSSAAKQSTYKRDHKPIFNMKHVETDASHQAVFDHLKKMGYKKTSGYNPKPNEFDVHHNRDEMTSKTDPVHHSSGVSAHVETEHGGKTKVHFTHRNMKEETMTQSFKGFLTSLTELTDKQKKHIDKNNNGKIDGHDFKLLRKEDDQTEESHQSKTTMKHIPNASPALKKAAKDIKPGVAGYRDRIDMLKAGGVKEEAELDEIFADQGSGSTAKDSAAYMKRRNANKHTPVAPVPDRKYIKGTPENIALKASRKPINGMPTGKMKEETELDELSKSTLGSYAKKASRDAVITRKIGADFERKADAARSPGMKAANTELSSKYKQKSWKRRDGLEKAVDRLSKEEVELQEDHLSDYRRYTQAAKNAKAKGDDDIAKDATQKAEKSAAHYTRMTGKKPTFNEAFINGREYASHGLMHPDHAKMDIHQKANREVDFYASKTGDKMQGKVMKNDGKEVHIQAHKELGDGKLHKFKVTPNLPKTTNEAVKKDDVPFDGPYTKTSGDGSVKDKSGAVHGPLSRARDLARKAMQKKMKEEYNIEITEEQAADLCDTASINEKMDMTKADMGDVIKDFKKSDAPQFAGKSDEKRREMAIAAKLQADRGGKKSYREFVELLAPQIQEGSPDEKHVDVAENAFDWKKSKAPASSGRYDIKQDGNRTIVTRKYNPDTGHSTGTDDDEKPAGEKRGRGRPSGSTSGAKQKGSANKSDYRGIDYKTHALHLPNSK